MTQNKVIDLDIDNYELDDILRLFDIPTNFDEEDMKRAKQRVLKSHPDKSRLPPKYFLFYSKAYKVLFQIYEFRNKSSNKKQAENYEDVIPDSAQTEKGKEKALANFFNKNSQLKESKNFNNWFNEQFEKHKLEDPHENGYGNWLKSDEDIIFTPQNINKDSMNREIEKRKKEIKSLTEYKGVDNTFFSSSAGGSALMEYNSNFTSGTLFTGGGGMGYTDLRQAYVESVIPVTEDDFKNVQKFKSVNEYKRHRDTVDTTPLSKEESMHQLYKQEQDMNQESAALAYYYAQQTEKAKHNNENFWSGLKHLTN